MFERTTSTARGILINCIIGSVYVTLLKPTSEFFSSVFKAAAWMCCIVHCYVHNLLIQHLHLGQNRKPLEEKKYEIPISLQR